MNRNSSYKREWYLKNRVRILARLKERRSQNPAHFKLINQRYRTKHALKIRRHQSLYQREKVAGLRSQLFNILGGYRCVHCGYKDQRALQLDHINGGGSKEVRSFAKSHGRVLYYQRYTTNPDLARKTLQVLCANCNWIKKHTHCEISGPQRGHYAQ